MMGGVIGRLLGLVTGGRFKMILGLGAIIALGLYVLSRETRIAHLSNKIDQRTAQIKAISDANARERLARQVEMQANMARVAREQEAINDEIETAHLRSDADWRTRFDRLRRERHGGGGATGAQLSATGQAPGQPDGPDPDPGQPADPEMIAVRVDDLETLVLGAQRGRDLQDWAARQATVATAPE